MRFLTVYLIALALGFSFFTSGCSSSSIQEEIPDSDDAVSAQADAFSIDWSGVFPDDIEGCSCYYGSDRSMFEEQKYIFTADLDNIAYVWVNGEAQRLKWAGMEKLDDDNHIERYTGDLYDAVLEVSFGEVSGDETVFSRGTITLTDKNGNSVSSVFFGECGC